MMIVDKVKSLVWPSKINKGMHMSEDTSQPRVLSYLDQEEIQHGDICHPFFPMLNSVVARFRSKLNYLEYSTIQLKTFCHIGLLSHLKLMLTKILDEAVEKVTLRELDRRKICSSNKDLFEKFSTAAKFECYDSSIMRLFSSLFEGIFRQELKEIDKILEDTSLPPFMKAVEASLVLESLFRLSLVTLNNLQISCRAYHNNAETKCPPHELCTSKIDNFLLIPICKEHLLDKQLLTNIINELNLLDKENIMVFVDVYKMGNKPCEEKFVIPKGVLDEFFRTVKCFNVYYITSHEYVSFEHVTIDDEVFLSDNIEVNLARDFWRISKERYPVMRFKHVTKIITDAAEIRLNLATS